MYISASDSRVASCWIVVTTQHSLVCDVTCPDTLSTRLCSVFYVFSVMYLLHVCVFVVSVSVSDCLERLFSEMTLSLFYNNVDGDV